MGIRGIGAAGYQTAGFCIGGAKRDAAGKGFENTVLRETRHREKPAGATRQAPVQEIYNNMSRFGGRLSIDENAISGKLKENGQDCERSLPDGELEQTVNQESETKTEILVKPDGSRVLVMTMSVGGMETTMSLEISKPTKAPNEDSKQDTNAGMPAVETDAISDEVSDISTED